jgi:L-iditol 2-dehydrogenase
MIRKLGTFVEFGVFGADTTVNWSVIGDRKELDIRGAHIGGQHGYDVAISMLEKGIIKADRIVTHELPLSDWKRAFDMAYAGEESIKVVLNPDK